MRPIQCTLHISSSVKLFFSCRCVCKWGIVCAEGGRSSGSWALPLPCQVPNLSDGVGQSLASKKALSVFAKSVGHQSWATAGKLQH